MTRGPARWAEFFALERNVGAASLAVLLVGLGEELWKKFMPQYLVSLGAGTTIVGLFGAAEDFFDAVYQYPGGRLADKLGRRAALILFLGAAFAGYIVYFFSPSWPYLFAGLALVMAWQSMASPAIFATIGDALPSERRTMGFSVQSLLKRVPMVISPVIGGAVIGAYGIRAGMKCGLGITLLIAAAAAPLLAMIQLPGSIAEATNLAGVWNSFHGGLKRLLLSDIAIRTCEGMADIFAILYVTSIRHIGVAKFGVLVAIQLGTSIAVYVPAAKLVDRWGRKPFVIATFLFFAAYPVTIVMARNLAWMVVAFVAGGLREIGEPARKAMIVNFANPMRRARTVGLYYLVRGLSITPASIIGGLLWKVRPEIPFVVAGMFGIAGTVIFALQVSEQQA